MIENVEFSLAAPAGALIFTHDFLQFVKERSTLSLSRFSDTFSRKQRTLCVAHARGGAFIPNIPFTRHIPVVRRSSEPGGTLFETCFMHVVATIAWNTRLSPHEHAVGTVSIHRTGTISGPGGPNIVQHINRLIEGVCSRLIWVRKLSSMQRRRKRG